MQAPAAAVASPTALFTVKTLSAQVLRVERPIGSSVGELKIALCTPPREGWWDPDAVKLICNGSVLKDEQSLEGVAEYLSVSADRFISALVKPDKRKSKIDVAKIDRLAAEGRALNPAATAMADSMMQTGMGADMLGPSAIAAAMQAVNTGACSMSAGASAAVAAADVDCHAKRTVEAVVSCASVSLKLTLGDRLLGKPLLAALIEPFLGAYNKKVVANGNATLTFDDLLCVDVDGVEVDAHELAGEVLQSDRVEVRLRTTGPAVSPPPSAPSSPPDARACEEANNAVAIRPDFQAQLSGGIAAPVTAPWPIRRSE